MAQAIYREWFVHFRFPGYKKLKLVNSPLGPIPIGWPVVSFTEIADVLSGGTPRTTEPSYWNGTVPFFTPKDAPGDAYVITTKKQITEEGLDRCNSRLYPGGTVFITARGTVGKVVLAGSDMAMNQSCYALRGRDGIGQTFLFLATRGMADALRGRSHGAVFDTIIIDTFRLTQVVKPPLTLVRSFEESVEPVFSLILNLQRRNEKLRQTRDFLLPKLNSGEVDVSDLDINVGDAAA